MILGIPGSFHIQGVISGLLFIVLFLALYLRERKTQIRDSLNQSEIYNRFRSTFVKYQQNPFNNKVHNRLETEVGDYQPPWWYSSHLGTLIAFGLDQQLQYESEMFENEDGRFTVDWYPHKPEANNEKRTLNVIVFLPGLGLTAKNKFAQNFATTVAAGGYYIAVVGSRGIDVPLKTSKFWHPSHHDDATTVVNHLHEVYGNLRNTELRVFLTGYSAGSNVTQRVILHTRDKPCARVIKGAVCVCINYDYLTSRRNLEGSLVGAVYSMLMTYALKDIIRKNAHVHDELKGGSTHINRLLTSCTFMSDYDRIFSGHIHNFNSVDELNGVCSMHEAGRINIPLLAVQPSDDPLHMGRVRENICLDKVTCNPNLIYLEPQHGNHFGFYEGGLRSAFSNTSSYTYPARLAVTFFNTIIEEENEGVRFGHGVGGMSGVGGIGGGVGMGLCGCHDSTNGRGTSVSGGVSAGMPGSADSAHVSGVNKRMATRSFSAM